MKNIRQLLCAAALALGTLSSAHAALYTNNFGTNVGTGSTSPSNCDDCSTGIWNFSGSGQTINFFGSIYSGLYVGSNGYVTFGHAATSFSTAALDTQTVAPMIAGSFTDLDARGDDASNVFVNDTNAGELIVTWDGMGHFNQNYSARSTFQLVIRSDQATIPGGQSQIGFFYGDMFDGAATSAGFGDGLGSINPGELALASFVPGTSLGNSAPRWFSLAGGIPDPVSVPEPGSIALMGLGLAGFMLARRRSKV